MANHDPSVETIEVDSVAEMISPAKDEAINGLAEVSETTEENVESIEAIIGSEEESAEATEKEAADAVEENADSAEGEDLEPN